MANDSRMNTPPSSTTTVDLSGDPNVFPNTGIALATQALADRVNWLDVVDQLLPWDPARARTGGLCSIRTKSAIHLCIPCSARDTEMTLFVEENIPWEEKTSK